MSINIVDIHGEIEGDYDIIKTLPYNATNGDIIKALFPNIEIYDSEKMESIYTGIPFGKYIGANVDCMRDWWNAPYTKENKNGSTF